MIPFSIFRHIVQNISIIKITAIISYHQLGGGNACYNISRGAINLEFGEIKVVSRIRKVKKFGINKFNTNGIM